MAHDVRSRHSTNMRASHGATFLAPSSVPADAPLVAAQQTTSDGIEPGAIQTAHFDPKAVVGGLVNGPAEVVVDDAGILIKNGKLRLQDEYGTTVAGAAGFAGGWADFIRDGLYGSDFAGGTIGYVAPGRTAILPYWTVTLTGAPTVTLVSDAEFPAGRCVRAAFSAVTDRVLLASDIVPVIGGSAYTIAYTVRETSAGAAEVQTDLRVRWYDANGVYIRSFTGMASGQPVAGRVALTTPYGLYSPPNARFASMELTLYEFIAHDALAKVEVGGIRLQPVAVNIDESLYLKTSQAEFGELRITGDALVPPESGHGSLSVGGDGDMYIVDGAESLRFSVTSQGAIDTYDGNEFGSYTPVVTNGGTVTWGERSGRYQRIGNMVWVEIDLFISGAGSGASAIGVSLPVPMGFDNGNQRQVLSGFAESVGTPWSGNIFGLSDSSDGSLLQRVRNSAGTNFTGANLLASGRLVLQGWYRAA